MVKRQSLPERLRKAIQASGLSANQLAKESGVAHPVITRFLAGERDILLGTADKLAAALGLELRERMKKPQ